MPVEIERKYLVINENYKRLTKGILYKQGYLSVDKERPVRIRLIDKKAFLTIKGIAEGAKRLEYEYEVDFLEAKEILDKLCIKPVIEKLRYKINYKNNLWEVDEFFGVNEGLVVAEIELKNCDENFEKPDWIGEEVTLDTRYANSNLVKNPFTTW